MNKFLGALLLITLSVFAWANTGAAKYSRGDCITPVVESYSWYGKYATVEAFSSIDGFSKEKSYILAFPYNGSNSTIFSKEIEAATKKVKTSLCGN